MYGDRSGCLAEWMRSSYVLGIGVDALLDEVVLCSGTGVDALLDEVVLFTGIGVDVLLDQVVLRMGIGVDVLLDDVLRIGDRRGRLAG